MHLLFLDSSGSLQVPRLDTTATEVVPTRQLLEDALLTIAHGALAVGTGHLRRCRDFVLKSRKRGKSCLEQDTFF